MHQQIHAPHSNATAVHLEGVFEDLFIRGPASDASASLVYEGESGAVAGFLGRIPHRMTFAGRPLEAHVATQLMVAPTVRGLVAMQLLRAFLGGKQHLSLADAPNEATARLWQAAGAELILSHSMYWTHPLRPLRATAARGRARLTRTAVLAARPLISAIDAIAWHTATETTPLRGDTVRALDVDGSAPERAKILTRWPLRPAYEPGDLERFIGQVRANAGSDPVECIEVRGSHGELLGWCVYVARRGGTGDVAQLVASRGMYERVLQRVFTHAHERGVVALSGRTDAAALPGLAATHCTFSREGPSLFAHSPYPGILHALHRGDAFLGWGLQANSE